MADAEVGGGTVPQVLTFISILFSIHVRFNVPFVLHEPRGLKMPMKNDNSNQRQSEISDIKSKMPSRHPHPKEGLRSVTGVKFRGFHVAV